MKFVKEHHKEVRSVALVTDSRLGVIGPEIARFFVVAKIKHFDYDSLDDAVEWIKREA